MGATTPEQLVTYLNRLGTITNQFALVQARRMVLDLPEEKQAIGVLEVAERTTDCASFSIMMLLLEEVIENCEDEDSYWIGFDMMCHLHSIPFISRDSEAQADVDDIREYGRDLCHSIIDTGLHAQDTLHDGLCAALALIETCHERDMQFFIPELIVMAEEIIKEMPEDEQAAARSLLMETSALNVANDPEYKPPSTPGRMPMP